MLRELATAMGSSPRVRGKHGLTFLELIESRLIPARAGKTVGVGIERHRAGAHPRACGENSVVNARRNSISGSSPRVRGKPLHILGDEQPDGLIPARAGKTAAHIQQRVIWRAHPRACGENPKNRAALKGGRGSSPRVRGKL